MRRPWQKKTRTRKRQATTNTMCQVSQSNAAVTQKTGHNKTLCTSKPDHRNSEQNAVRCRASHRLRKPPSMCHGQRDDINTHVSNIKLLGTDVQSHGRGAGYTSLTDHLQLSRRPQKCAASSGHDSLRHCRPCSVKGVHETVLLLSDLHLRATSHLTETDRRPNPPISL